MSNRNVPYLQNVCVVPNRVGDLAPVGLRETAH